MMCYCRPAFVLGSDGDTTVPVSFLDSIHSKPSLSLTVTRIPSRKTRHQGSQVVLLTKIYDSTPIDDWRLNNINANWFIDHNHCGSWFVHTNSCSEAKMAKKKKKCWIFGEMDVLIRLPEERRSFSQRLEVFQDGLFQSWKPGSGLRIIHKLYFL